MGIIVVPPPTRAQHYGHEFEPTASALAARPRYVPQAVHPIEDQQSGRDTSVVAVIGVGYVGFGLVEAFSQTYRVIAFDVSAERVRQLSRAHNHLDSVEWTTNPARISAATHFLISVPTLVKDDKTIDTSYIHSAIKTIEKYAAPGSTIVIESSVAVGMTRNLLTPLMLERGFKGGMSPERVDPGRKAPTLQEIPKLISGLDDVVPGSLKSIQDLYSHVFDVLVPTTTPEVAEMTKLYENCQRMMTISFANEMANACADLGIDAYEVSKAAATKPFGYLAVAPGLGVGGHCIPVNPYYLFHSGGFPLLKEATNHTELRPSKAADEAMTALLRRKPNMAVQDARVLVVGLGFKPGESLTTNSPGLALLRHLHDAWSVNCQWYDPVVEAERFECDGKPLSASEWENSALERFDLIIVTMKQNGVNLDEVEGLKHPLVVKFCQF